MFSKKLKKKKKCYELIIYEIILFNIDRYSLEYFVKSFSYNLFHISLVDSVNISKKI